MRDKLLEVSHAAYNLGISDFKRGVKLKNSPYTESSNLWYNWSAGWGIANADSLLKQAEKSCNNCKFEGFTGTLSPCYICCFADDGLETNNWRLRKMKRDYGSSIPGELDTDGKLNPVLTPENNGGKTGYYNLPLPDKAKVKKILMTCVGNNVDETVDKLLALCPQTLNDLIEFKKMAPWQHECFKANYTLNARAEKNGGSKIRKINKMAYYTERGLEIAKKDVE